MQFPAPLVGGTLVRRYKRFLADIVLDDGREIIAHCANSGTMRACAEPGWRVLCSPANNPKRKLKWTWEIVFAGDAGDVPTLINTARPNHVVRDGIERGVVPALRGYAGLRSEVRYGVNSRIDLLLEQPTADASDRRPACYVEVKNCTLFLGDGVGAFPDAVTARGRKHLVELSAEVAAGNRAVQFFLVPRGDVTHVRPADEIDPAYGQALRDAAAAGVEVMAWRATVTPERVVLECPLPVHL